MPNYSWLVEDPTRGTQTGIVYAKTRREAEIKASWGDFEKVDYNITWSGIPRVIGKRKEEIPDA